MSDLGDRLKRHVEGSAEAIGIDEVRWRTPRRGPSWRVAAVAAAVVVCTVAAVAAIVVRSSDGDIEARVGADVADVGPGNEGRQSESCGADSFGGLTIDARNWRGTSEAAELQIVTSEDCTVTELDVLVASGSWAPRSIVPSGADGLPLSLRAGDGIRIGVTNNGGAECGPEPTGDAYGWLNVVIADYLAESRQRYPTNRGCAYSVSVERVISPTPTEHPSCDIAAGFVNAGERDYAGTRNTTFINRGTVSCRIDSVDVQGITPEGVMVPFTDYGDGDIAGFSDNMLPALLGPGRGIAVLLVSRPDCLPPSTVIESTAVAVAGHEIQVQTERLDACKGSYTVDLIEEID